MDRMMRFITLVTFFLFSFSSLHAAPISVESVSAHIQKSVHTRLKGKNKTIVQNIYDQSGYRPLWVDEKNKKKMSALIRALNDPLFNYKNKSFDQKSIKRLFFLLDNNEISPAKQAAVYARLDMILTNSMVRLARFIVEGDVDWVLVQEKLAALEESDNIKANWEMRMKSFSDAGGLTATIQRGNIYAYLKSLLPMKERYLQLIKLLKNYRIMEKFPKIDYNNSPLKLGDWSSRVKLVKRRLQISGDYPQNAPIDRTFDRTLQQAVISYQKRYNLKVDGMVDKVMTYYLNQPAKTNIQSIITNLDKLKLYPESFENEHVEVNIPDFNLRYYKNGHMVMKKGVVVGRIDRPTPLFDDQIQYMVLNPTWTIPDNLIKKDLIHVLRENPSYLQENNILVYSGDKEINITQDMLDPYEKSDARVPYRFVQQPGENNALGRVKFMFPNKYAVYLHDTDNKSLLSRRYKVYSSGCMRVDEPFDLMNALLEHTNGNYTRNKIDEILRENKPTTVNLKRSIPLHIVYFTVYEENGISYFKNDIYLYDKIIEESTERNRKETFTVPKKRLISVKENGRIKKNENLRP